jgi:hypothetical protein
MKVLEALLASGAIDRGDLEIALTLNPIRPEVPTHREFLPIAEAACSRESLRTPLSMLFPRSIYAPWHLKFVWIRWIRKVAAGLERKKVSSEVRDVFIRQ